VTAKRTNHQGGPVAGSAWAGGLDWLAGTALAATLGVVALRVSATFALDGGEAPGGSLLGGGAAIGRVGTGITDVACVAGLALAILAQARRRRQIHRLLVGLWLVGSVVVGVSGVVRGDGSAALSWIGATAAGLAAMHLAARPGARRVLLAGMAAMAVPLAGEAIFQTAYQHRSSVAFYEAQREAIAADRGWEEGSAMQRMFEHRVYENTATGAFGLANVFASVLVGCGFLAGGLALRRGGAWRGRRLLSGRPGGRDRAGGVAAGAMAACAALALIGVVLSQSRGAGLAGVIGLIGAGLASTSRRRWVGAAVAAGLVVVVWAAIGARGWVGPPETAAGERSLLFRWFYIEASVEMVREAPVLGIGPGAFQDWYARLKNPLSPEDVAGPHNVFAAWIASGGIGGWAWSAMLVCMFVMTGRGLGSGRGRPRRPMRAPAGGGGGSVRMPGVWLIAAASGAIVFATRFAVQFVEFAPTAAAVALVMAGGWYAAWRACRGGAIPLGVGLGVATGAGGLLLLPSVGLWAISAFGFVGLTGWLATRPPARWGVRIGLAGAAIAVVVHGQIDMGLTHVMSAPMLLAVVGVAASSGRGPASRSRRGGGGGCDRVLAGMVAAAAGGAIALAVVGARAPYVSPARLAHRQAVETVQRWAPSGTAEGRDRVVGALERWLALRPYDARAHGRAGRICLRVGAYGRAEEWLGEALRLDEQAYLDPMSRMSDGRRAEVAAALGEARRLDRARRESVD